MGSRRRVTGIGVTLFGLAVCAFSSVSFAGNEIGFARPSLLEPNVRFWVKVFGSYAGRDLIVHDRDKVDRVYQVMHIPGSGEPSGEEVESVSNYLKNKYTGILNRLASGAKPADYEERHVAEMFAGAPPQAYNEAVQNLRVQQGLRERFGQSLLRERYYRPTMERILRSAGLPPELLALGAVESGYYPWARSRKGAVGIWQFTPATGREYMTISRFHDDRVDPAASTEAAAQLLRKNYELLKSWPLAITAYNYGTNGMLRAAEEYNYDYARIVQNYSGGSFGFAVKNYYPEFLAALQIEQHEDDYFPELRDAQLERPTPPSSWRLRRIVWHRRPARTHHHLSYRHQTSHKSLRHHHLRTAARRGDSRLRTALLWPRPVPTIVPQRG
jgi:membrane-bound lytic murein transglycosylase D